MDDQRGGGALARGLLELVRPAPVVGHLLAVEELVVAGMEARVVDQDHHRLAGPVLVAVVVPLPLRRVDAIADENDRAVLDADLRLAGAGTHHHVGAEGQRHRRAIDGQVQRRGGIGGGLDHRHVLEIAVAIARLQADALHLRTDVLDRAFFPGRAGRAALELVGSQRLHQVLEVAGIDRRRERVRAGRNGGSGRVRRGRRGGSVGLLAAGERESASGQADQDFAGHRNSGWGGGVPILAKLRPLSPAARSRFRSGPARPPSPGRSARSGARTG